jgi:general secretion pathway protein G
MQWEKFTSGRLQVLLRTIRKRMATPRKQSLSECGMTLVEIMVVVVIISLVAGVVGVQVFGQLRKAQENTARTQMKQLGEALDLYKLSNRRYPGTGEGLGALVAPPNNAQPFMNTVPKDPWGNEYVYISPGTQNSAGYDIMSHGQDGVPGGGDDISNWQQEGGQ